MISAIVPSYRNPKCLNICIQSFIDTTNSVSNELICVIDGFTDIYQDLMEKYKNYSSIHFLSNQQNRGMPLSINMGVYYANHSHILVINDDNVFPRSWDSTLNKYQDEDLVVSPNQIERQPSIFNFLQYDFGDINNFRYKEFLDKEPTMRQDTLSNDGEIFPFFMSKKRFMAVGGFDLIYPSPFVCDWDFFLKLEIIDTRFVRTRAINFYHFGSIATKNSNSVNDAHKFAQSEQFAAQVFYQKWGFHPYIDRPSNSHMPKHLKKVKGVSFNE